MGDDVVERKVDDRETLDVFSSSFLESTRVLTVRKGNIA